MRRRIVVIASVLVLVGLVLAFPLWRRAPPARESAAVEQAEESTASADVVVLDEATRRTVGLKVERVVRRPFADTIKTTGVVGPNETRVAHVRVLAPGRADQVFVRAGDRVASGQPLLSYDNIELGSLVGDYLTALAAVDRAAADEMVAKRALERADRLVEAGGLSRAEYDRRDAEHQRTVSEVSSARAAVTNLEKKLARFGVSADALKQLQTSAGSQDWSTTTIRSPFTGVVTMANVAPGDAVDTQQELFTVADLTTVWVSGDLYQKDLGAVRPGQDAIITTESYPEEVFTGRVTYVSDALNPATRTAKVRCEVPNRTGRLKLQMLVDVQLPTSSTREALVVQVGAVQDLDGRSVVFVQTKDDTFEVRAIETGTSDGRLVSITSGLTAGDAVVTTGAFMLKSKLKAGSIASDDDEAQKK